jgi:hypothetical protein
VIEPTAEKLIPIAEELKDVYRQIELLEVLLPSTYATVLVLTCACGQALVERTGENIKHMASKVEKTEQALRREERALNEGKPLAMWKEPDQIKVFRAADYVENGRLKESPRRPGTPIIAL